MKGVTDFSQGPIAPSGGPYHLAIEGKAFFEVREANGTTSYTRDGAFVTAFYAVLDPTARTLKYATAGHNPPRLARGKTVASLDEEGGLPLGLFPGQSYNEITVGLEPGDLLLLYTDGATEAMAPGPEAERQLFGVERLDSLLIECDTRSAADCIARIGAELADFRGQAGPADDQTLIALRCLKAAP